MDRLTSMQVLVRVVETGSFSGAARQLRVGQPAVSKTIAQLEERLGVSLLLRSSRGLTPTEAGQNFYKRAKRSIEEADEAELAAREAGNGLAGRLRFSSGVTFGRLHIIPRLPLFLGAHPELTVEAVLDDRDVDLIEEGIDVGFRMGVLADSAIVARKIGQSRRLVLGTPAYFEKAGEPSTPAELADHQAVIFDLCPMKGRSTWSFRSGTAEETVTLKGSVRTTAAEGLREAVFAGLGLCVASEWMFQPDLDNGRVKQVLPAWTLLSMDLWVAFPTGRRASAKARAFAAFIEDQLRQANFAEQPAVGQAFERRAEPGEFRTSLPRNAARKAPRRVLREPYWEHQSHGTALRRGRHNFSPKHGAVAETQVGTPVRLEIRVG